MSTTASNHDNPLLDFSDLPRFGEIRPEHVTPALDVLLADAAAAVERSVAAVLAEGKALTYDLGGTAKCSEVGTKIAEGVAASK